MLMLIIETTTGQLVPVGSAPSLPRGATDILLQFVTNGVANLLPNGSNVLWKLFAETDLVNPVATLSSWTSNATDKTYKGTLDTLTGAIAAIVSGTLRGRVDYGSGPTQSAWHQINYGVLGSSPGVVPIIVISQPAAGPNQFTEVVGYVGGKVTVGQASGWLVAKVAQQILGFQLEEQDQGLGADTLIEATKNGAATGKIATLTAGNKTQATTFGSPLVMAAGDVVAFKPNQVGSTKPGSNLTVKAVIQYL